MRLHEVTWCSHYRFSCCLSSSCLNSAHITQRWWDAQTNFGQAEQQRKNVFSHKFTQDIKEPSCSLSKSYVQKMSNKHQIRWARILSQILEICLRQQSPAKINIVWACLDSVISSLLQVHGYSLLYHDRCLYHCGGWRKQTKGTKDFILLFLVA